MSGIELLQIPGPTNVPRPILDAIAQPTIDHRSPAFAETYRRVAGRLRNVVGTVGPVVIYPASGTGAWEAALVNTLSPGDGVLFYAAGYFAERWRALAERLDLKVTVVTGDWRRGIDAAAIAGALENDRSHALRAVCVVHNETSTGAASDIGSVRRALDATGHPALLMVDTISSLGSLPYAQDDLGVDVTVAASQKGLMLPPGLSFNGIGPKALEAYEAARLPRFYWDWADMLARADDGWLPYTPATNLVMGLDRALELLLVENSLPSVFERHRRLADICRSCVAAWGLEFQIVEEAERSDALTAVRMPEGSDADDLRALVRDRFGVALGNGLGPLRGRVFRIGHLGDLNDAMLAGALAAIESGLRKMQVPLRSSGLDGIAYRMAEGPGR